MGGKKKGKGGKKGKKKGNDTDPDPMERNFILQAEIESLTQKLIMEQDMADRSKASEMRSVTEKSSWTNCLRRKTTVKGTQYRT